MPAQKRKRRASKKSVVKSNYGGFGKLKGGFFVIFRKLLVGLAAFLVLMILALVAASAWFWFQKEWNGQNRASVLMIEKDSGNVRLYSYEKDSGVILNLGSEVMVSTVHGYGDYKLGVLSKLGKQDGYGLELLKDTVETWLGVNVLGVVEVDKFTDEVVTKKVWQDFRNKLILSAHNTVPVGDRWFLWSVSRDLGSSNIYYLDLRESAIYGKEKLADGATVFNPDNNRLESLVGLRLYDSLVVARPDMPVTVVNTTGRLGLARATTVVLSNMGYDVVSVVDQAESLEKTQIFTDVDGSSDESYRYFLSPLETYFGVRATKEPGLLEKYRSRVVVKLGKDYLKLLEEK